MKKSGNNIVQGSTFNVLALNKMKTVEPKKTADISDLFKCVKSLSDSTSSLTDYAYASNDEFVDKVNSYLDALVKIQQGLLDIAKEKVSQIKVNKTEEKPEQLEANHIDFMRKKIGKI